MDCQAIRMNFPKNIRTALIDMDGVLYDSMPYHTKAWDKMMKEQGIGIDINEYFLYEGMTGKATIDLLFKRELGKTVSDEEAAKLYERKAEIFREIGEKKLMPGASEMLLAMRKLGWNTVLVTGSAQGNLLNSLDKDYPGFFPAERRVTALDVKNGKPNPEPYLKGLQKANVSISEAIVVENAPLGVKAGKAAGCFTIAVMTGPIPKNEFEKAGADLIFPSMRDFALFLQEMLWERFCEEIDNCIENLSPANTTIISDENVMTKVFPLLKCSKTLRNSNIVTLLPGETHKDLNSLVKIWESLEKNEATRKSVIVNIGGGIVTDIGGFAAATYKRGIRYVNVPTTLLGAVDAATGGKTGINFMGLKNEIGAFHKPEAVIISAMPLSTLPDNEIMSGYAEMIKVAMTDDNDLYLRLLDVEGILADSSALEVCMKSCVEIKRVITETDPFEKGVRKILNFGHTAGHAFESFMLGRRRSITHGSAVAHGILVALLLSNMVYDFPTSEITRYVSAFLKPFYSRLGITCDDIPQLISLMGHDKKNSVKAIPSFVLLERIGAPVLDCNPDVETISKALELYREIME